jgi:hypothetical protein
MYFDVQTMPYSGSASSYGAIGRTEIAYFQSTAAQSSGDRAKYRCQSGIDSKLRACDLLNLKVRDISHGERISAQAIVVQRKTSRPVQFEITESTRTALAERIKLSGLASDDFLFPSRVHASPI